MTALHRHQLAWLSPSAWQQAQSGRWDGQAQACLAHWSRQGLPVVVTRQQSLAGDTVGLGVAAPACWDHRRIALALPRQAIARLDAFPSAVQLGPLLAPASRKPWRALCGGLAACGVVARVYGSHGWQLLTGLDHLRPSSDIDLCIAVAGPAQADAVAVLLRSWSDDLPLDGELIFPGDQAVAWREWLSWRAGRATRVLVKRLDGVALADAPFWPVEETA